MGPRSRLRDAAALLVGTGLGTGFAPVASGTAGSAVGVLLHVLISPGGLAASAAAAAALAVAGAWSAGVLDARYRSHDNRRIVIDEILGQLIALATFPPSAGALAAGFLLFRLFDIWKPFPARRLDRNWRTPAGVMADDVVAGLYANGVLQALRAAGVI